MYQGERDAATTKAEFTLGEFQMIGKTPNRLKNKIELGEGVWSSEVFKKELGKTGLVREKLCVPISLCYVCLPMSPFAKVEWPTVRLPYRLILNEAISLRWVDLNEKVSVGTHLRFSRIPTNASPESQLMILPTFLALRPQILLRRAWTSVREIIYSLLFISKPLREKLL